jgi:hypothetical protein
VLGGPPRQDPEYLAEIGFLAQEIPLYRHADTAHPARAGRYAGTRPDQGAGEVAASRCVPACPWMTAGWFCAPNGRHRAVSRTSGPVAG